MVQYFPIVTGSLTVTGSVLVSGSITTNSTITATTLVVQTITSSISAITGSTNFGSLSSNTHTFTGSILASGSIGIGTNLPAEKLSVYLAASKSVYARLGANNLPSIGFLNDNATSYVPGEINASALTTNCSITAVTSSTTGTSTLLTLGKSSGYGTVNFNLSYDNTYFTNGKNLTLLNEAGYGAGIFAWNNAGTQINFLVPNGNVGIGTNNPGYKLSVAGTIGATDLILQGSSNLTYSYTTNSSWASGFQTIIPINGPQATTAVYLVKVNWGSGGSPYVVYGAFLWVCMGSNGGGADNTITPMISTHQGGTGTMNFRNIAGSGQVASGIQVQLIGFANPDGTLGVTATRLM